jgi:hypothetical protein
VVGSEPKVARNFTWAVLAMEDGNFRIQKVSLDGTPDFEYKYQLFLPFTFAPLFVLDKSIAWNRCLQHPCFQNLCKIAQASKNLDSNTQHFLSDLLTHS